MESDAKAETPEEFRQRIEELSNRFYENFEKRGGPYRSRAFEYEKLAVDYSHKGFQTLTYLNGGALVAIPAALSFFKTEVPHLQILVTAAFFIAGLLAVVFAQGAAFFTMAKRSEAQEHLKNEQFNRIAALGFPQTNEEFQNRQRAADADAATAAHKIYRSNVWRLFGLTCFIGSALIFISGCSFGAMAVAHATQRSAQPPTVAAQ